MIVLSVWNEQNEATVHPVRGSIVKEIRVSRYLRNVGFSLRDARRAHPGPWGGSGGRYRAARREGAVQKWISAAWISAAERGHRRALKFRRSHAVVGVGGAAYGYLWWLAPAAGLAPGIGCWCANPSCWCVFRRSRLKAISWAFRGIRQRQKSLGEPTGRYAAAMAYATLGFLGVGP